MKRITIEHVSRIEGHGKITIHLDDHGHVASTEFHVTQIRGFEKFTEGHPFYEMPGITARICGICPISHSLASAKACDSIMAVRIAITWKPAHVDLQIIGVILMIAGAVGLIIALVFLVRRRGRPRARYMRSAATPNRRA